MATTQSGNIYYTTAASLSIAVPNIRLVGMYVHGTHATDPAVVVLANNDSGRSYPVMLSLELDLTQDSSFFDMSSCPMVFPNGIRIVTLTNAQITLILDRNIQDVR